MNHYINEDGNTVFTSAFHRKKGSCCHSNCLHCPFGTTLKNIGVQIHSIDSNDQAEAKSLFDSLYSGGEEVSASLLAGAFGESKKTFDPEQYVILSLKNIVCGMAKRMDDRFSDIRLKEHFQDQGINESYLNSLV